MSAHLSILARQRLQGPRVHNARYDLEFFVEQTVDLLENIGRSLTSLRRGAGCGVQTRSGLGSVRVNLLGFSLGGHNSQLPKRHRVTASCCCWLLQCQLRCHSDGICQIPPCASVVPRIVELSPCPVFTDFVHQVARIVAISPSGFIPRVPRLYHVLRARCPAHKLGKCFFYSVHRGGPGMLVLFNSTGTALPLHVLVPEGAFRKACQNHERPESQLHVYDSGGLFVPKIRP